MKFGQREGVWGHMGYQVSSVCKIVLPQRLYVLFCFVFFATFLLILEPIDYFQKSKEELEEVGVYGLG